MGCLSRSSRYEKVAATDSTDDFPQHAQSLPLPTRFRRNITSYLNLLFFLTNLTFLSTLLWTAHLTTSPNTLLKKTNTYTPLLDRYNFSFNRVKNNASLFNTPYSIYKDAPSPAVDAAWDAIADTPVLAISRSDVVKMGKEPEYVVRVPEAFGYGANKYFAVNDGQHLLHCLDELRKFAHYEYYYSPKYGAEANLPPMVKAHRSHCVGVLLDTLTCQPSLNMVVWEYVQGQSEPWPDFDTWRMCVDHGAFYEWQKGVQVDLEKIKGWDWGVGQGKEREVEEEELRRLREGRHGGHEGHWE